MPTPDRMPHPPGPPSGTKILADHEREKRRQQRPVSRNGSSAGASPVDDAIKIFHADDSTTWNGTSNDFTLSFSLPFDGVWKMEGIIDLVGRAEGDDGDLIIVGAQVVGVGGVRRLLATPAGAGGAWSQPIRETFYVHTVYAPGTGLGDTGTGLDQEFLVDNLVSGNTANWIDVSVHVAMTAYYLGATAERAGW